MPSILTSVTAVLLPSAFLLLYGYLKVTNPDLARNLIYEDADFEWFQFGCYLTAGLIGFSTAYFHNKNNQKSRSAFYFGFACCMIFMAFEEINWGQWLFNFELPDYFKENNSQKNLTLHNLKFIQPFLHSAYIALGLGLSTLCLLKPYLTKRLNFKAALALLPSPTLTLYFFPVAAFYIFSDYISPWLVSLGFRGARVAFDYKETLIIFSDQEAVECLLALGTLIYAFTALRESRLLPK